MKPSIYYFHMKTKKLANFQICISVPLNFPIFYFFFFFLQIGLKKEFDQFFMNRLARLAFRITAKSPSRLCHSGCAGEEWK